MVNFITFVFSEGVSTCNLIGAGIGQSVERRAAGCIRFPAGARNCSILHSVQTDSGVHPRSYLMGTGE
jgi:hypothetical protein